MTFKKIAAHLLVLFVLVRTAFIVIELLKKPYAGKVEVLPDHIDLIKSEQGLHTNYRRGDSGYLELKLDGIYRVIECSIAGWKAQSLYFRDDFAGLADECSLVE